MTPAQMQSLGEDIASLVDQFDDMITHAPGIADEQQLGGRVRKLVRSYRDGSDRPKGESRHCGFGFGVDECHLPEGHKGMHAFHAADPEPPHSPNCGVLRCGACERESDAV